MESVGWWVEGGGCEVYPSLAQLRLGEREVTHVFEPHANADDCIRMLASAPLRYSRGDGSALEVRLDTPHPACPLSPQPTS